MLFLAALVVVVTGTLIPAAALVATESWTDKILHVVAFAGLGLLGGTGWPDRRGALLFALPLLGLGLEIVQGAAIPGRQFDWLDAAANTIGVAAGLLASLVAARLLFARQA